MIYSSCITTHDYVQNLKRNKFSISLEQKDYNNNINDSGASWKCFLKNYFERLKKHGKIPV